MKKKTDCKIWLWLFQVNVFRFEKKKEGGEKRRRKWERKREREREREREGEREREREREREIERGRERERKVNLELVRSRNLKDFAVLPVRHRSMASTIYVAGKLESEPHCTLSTWLRTVSEHPETDRKGMVEIRFALSGASSVSDFQKLTRDWWGPWERNISLFISWLCLDVLK